MPKVDDKEDRRVEVHLKSVMSCKRWLDRKLLYASRIFKEYSG
jgi:hypothetical protein